MDARRGEAGQGRAGPTARPATETTRDGVERVRQGSTVFVLPPRPCASGSAGGAGEQHCPCRPPSRRCGPASRQGAAGQHPLSSRRGHAGRDRLVPDFAGERRRVHPGRGQHRGKARQGSAVRPAGHRGGAGRPRGQARQGSTVIRAGCRRDAGRHRREGTAGQHRLTGGAADQGRARQGDSPDRGTIGAAGFPTRLQCPSAVVAPPLLDAFAARR